MHTARNTCRRLLETEVASDFALLRRVPDTQVRHFLDYFERLEPSRRGALLGGLATAGSGWFAEASMREPARDEPDAPDEPDEIVERERLVNAWLRASQSWAPPFRYQDVATIRAAAQQARHDREHGVEGSSIAAELEARALAIRPVKAPEIRRAVKDALRAAAEDLAVTNLGGGDWQYEGRLDGRGFDLRVDYGSQFAPLRYGVDVRAVTRRPAPYEALLGVATGDWNLIAADNLADAAQLLVALTARVAAIGLGIGR